MNKLLVILLLVINTKSFCYYLETYFLAYSAEENVYMQSLNVLSEGKESCGKNPAGCGMEHKKSLSLSYVSLFLRENLASIRLFLPQKIGNIGIKLKYATFGEAEFVNENFDIKNESLYSIFLNLSYGKEFFIPGLFLGTDINFGNIKVDTVLFGFGIKFGFIYIINFVSTELHLAGVAGSFQYKEEQVNSLGIAFKYFLPEYKSFLSLAYNNNIDKFISFNIETEFIRGFTPILGYETTINGSLTNYSFAIKIKEKSVEIVGSIKYNTNLDWTTAISTNFSW